MNVYTSNGGIHLTDVTGGTVNVLTSNGPLVFDNVDAESLTGIASNGPIEGTLACTVSGEYDLDTSNGQIDLEVSPSSDVGFDLDLSTSNAAVHIGLSDLTYTVDENEHKKARTQGFGSKTVQIVIDVHTSNGNIDVDTL